MKYDLTGYNLDNLIKILVQKKVKIYNLNFKSRTNLTFEIDDCDVKKVKRYIKNFKFKQSFTKLKKLPSIMLANLGVILGCFIGSIFFIFASAFTWQIQVFGMEELSKSDIINVLEQNNVKTGKINLISSEEIENILLNNYDRIAQVSVIKQGTAIIINLSEKLVYKEEEFQPILAKSAGVITNIKVITGTTNVKVGDFVNVGDVLVLPFNLNSNGEKVSVKPHAEIQAKMFIIGKSELKKNEIKLVRTGNIKKEYIYKFKNFNLFSGKDKNSFALFETVVYNENVSDLVPLSREVRVCYELCETQIENNLAEKQQENEEISLNSARKNLVAGEILSENTTSHFLEDRLISISTITVLGSIND